MEPQADEVGPAGPSNTAERVPGVALVGYRGTGKSTVGRRLADRLNWPFQDTDSILAHRVGCSVSEAFLTLGEPTFRDLEAMIVDEWTRSGPIVLATGGGVVVRPANRRALRRLGLVVWLSARPETLAARLEADPVPRPALTARAPRDEIEEVLTQRRPLYAEVADLEIDTDPLTPAEVVSRLVEVIRRLDGGRVGDPC